MDANRKFIVIDFTIEELAFLNRFGSLFVSNCFFSFLLATKISLLSGFQLIFGSMHCNTQNVQRYVCISHLICQNKSPGAFMAKYKKIYLNLEEGEYFPISIELCIYGRAEFEVDEKK